MYCAFILKHSDAWYYNKKPHIAMSRGSHDQVVHLTHAMVMIAQFGSCGLHYGQKRMVGTVSNSGGGLPAMFLTTLHMHALVVVTLCNLYWWCFPSMFCRIYWLQ